MEIKEVRPSLPNSVERLCHDSGKTSFLLEFEREGPVSTALEAPRLERYIGLIYRSETERLGHYIDSCLSRQFDTYIWFDKTSAVVRLPEQAKAAEKVPGTYPFGTYDA